MRRKDKEITDKKIIEKILTASGFVRLGFFRNGRPVIKPAVLKALRPGGLLVSESGFSGPASFQANVCAGIRKGASICSCSTKYMSVYGVGRLENGEFFTEAVSAKASAMTEAEIAPYAGASCFAEGLSAIPACIPDIRLGIPCGEEIYIVPVNHAEINGTVYFHSAAEGRKTELLRENPEIIIEAEAGEPDKDGINWALWEASACTVTRPEEKTAAMTTIAGKFGGKYYEFTPESLKRVEIVRLDIKAPPRQKSRGSHT